MSAAGLLFDKRQRIGLAKLADCARRQGIEPQNLTVRDVVRFRDTFCVTANQKAALGRAVRIFDELRTVAGLEHVMPPAPLGPLPGVRASRAELLSAMQPGFRAEWTRWRSAYQRGTPSPLSGSSDPKSDGYMGQFDAAVLWLLESVEKHEIATVGSVRDLARPEWVQAAARAVLDDYDEDGQPIDAHTVPRLGLRSLRTYLERLKTVFDSFDCAIAARSVVEMLEDRALAGLGGMTPENIAFCRTLISSPSLQARFFELPWTLKAKAEALLARWDTLGAGERLAAVRAGACAVALLILIRCAPIRIGNLAAIPFRGEQRWLFEPAAGQLAVLHIPARFVKNSKEIRATLQNAGRRDSWTLVSWYLATVRPRMIDGSLDCLKAVDGPDLFPGESGHLTVSTLRNWIKLETAAAGLPMRPHQVRHALASILLNRHPDKIALVAALLGDETSTVESHYAWMDREKLVADAQGLIPGAAGVLREARRG